MLSTNELLQEVGIFYSQEIIQSLFGYIINHHRNDSEEVIFEWEKFMSDEKLSCGQAFDQQVSIKIIDELIGNLFRDGENVSFKKPILKPCGIFSTSDEVELFVKRMDQLMEVVNELIFMIREDRVLLNDLEEITKRMKLVSFWISVANSIVLYLFYVRLIVDFEKEGISNEWILKFNSKMKNIYLLYGMYQYIKMNFFSTASLSRGLQDINLDFNRVYDEMDSIKLDLSKDNHLPNTNMKRFEMILHIFSKYFFCESNKQGEFLYEYRHTGSIYVLEVVMNYLISINNRDIQSDYAERIFKCFSRKVKVSVSSNMHYKCIGLKRNHYILLHCIASSLISTLKQPISEQLFTLYNNMYYILNEGFNKDDESIIRLFKCEMIENDDLRLFQDLVNSSNVNEIYVKPIREKQLFFDKTDEFVLMNSKQSTERNIYESILFKVFFLIPHTSIATHIVIRFLPKVEKLETFIKCCMDCYFTSPNIEYNPFLGAIFYVLKYQLTYYKPTTMVINNSYQKCINMIKEKKQAVISYYSGYQTDSHYQNSKDLLDSILKQFTTDLYKVYARSLRVVLNVVICCLMDKGKREENDYISLFNSNFRLSIYLAFDNLRTHHLKDPYIYKYLSTFSLSSSYNIDILAKFNSPKNMEEVINDLYPKLALRHLIFVDSNQKHRTFIPLSVVDFQSVEELNIVEIMKKYKSFLQFSLYPQRVYFTDVTINFLN